MNVWLIADSCESAWGGHSCLPNSFFRQIGMSAPRLGSSAVVRLVDDDESANSSHLREQFHSMPNQSLPLKHWGLEHWPFCSTPGVGQFYPTAGHNEALARIEYLV